MKKNVILPTQAWDSQPLPRLGWKYIPFFLISNFYHQTPINFVHHTLSSITWPISVFLPTVTVFPDCPSQRVTVKPDCPSQRVTVNPYCLQTLQFLVILHNTRYNDSLWRGTNKLIRFVKLDKLMGFVSSDELLITWGSSVLTNMQCL